MAKDLELQIKILAKTQSLRQEVGRANELLRDMAGRVKDVAGSSEWLKGVAAEMGHLAAAAYLAKQAFDGLAGLTRVVDSIANVNSQLALVSRSSGEAAQAGRRLFDIAQASRVSYTDLADTYARVARSAGQLGLSQERMLGVTQAISQAMTISGGSMASMQAALVQLGQGLSSGTLRGEELNSILEQMPRLAQAIAAGMGVGVGELRKLGEQGRLTATAVVEALEKSAPQLAAEFERMTPTVAGSMQTVKNAFALAIAEFDKGAGASQSLATSLRDLGRALGEAAKNAREFGEAAKPALEFAGVVTAAVAAAGAIGLIGGKLKELALLLKNPFILAVVVAAGAADAVSQFRDSDTGLKARAGTLESEIGDIRRGLRSHDATYGGANAAGRKVLEDRLALAEKSLAEIRTEQKRRSPVTQATARATVNAGDFRRSEIIDANGGAPTAPFPGAQPLSVVQDYVKTALSIQEDWKTKAVAISESYANAIAKTNDPAEIRALEQRRATELTELARKSQDEIKGLTKKAGDEANALAAKQYDTRVDLAKRAADGEIDVLELAHARGEVEEREYQKRLAGIRQKAIADQIAILTEQYGRTRDPKEREGLAGKIYGLGTEAQKVAADAEIKTAGLERKQQEARERAAEAMSETTRKLGEDYARANEKAASAMAITSRADAELGESLRQVSEKADAAREAIAQKAAALKDDAAAQAAMRAEIDNVTAAEARQRAATVALWEEQQRLNASWEHGAIRALRSYLDEVQNVAATMERAMGNALRSLEAALTGFFENGKFEAKEFGNVIRHELANLAAKQVTGALAAVAEPAMKGLAGWATGLLAPTNHAGGVAGVEATAMRMVSPDVFKGAPRFHTGGIAGDEVPIIAKRGEGVFTEEQMKALAPAGAASQPVVVTSNLTINAPGADAGVLSRIRELMPAFIAENERTVMAAVNKRLTARGRPAIG